MSRIPWKDYPTLTGPQVEGLDQEKRRLFQDGKSGVMDIEPHLLALSKAGRATGFPRFVDPLERWVRGQQGESRSRENLRAIALFGLLHSCFFDRLDRCWRDLLGSPDGRSVLLQLFSGAVVIVDLGGLGAGGMSPRLTPGEREQLLPLLSNEMPWLSIEQRSEDAAKLIGTWSSRRRNESRGGWPG